MSVREEITVCCKQLRLSRNLVDNLDLDAGVETEKALLTLLKMEIEHREESRKARYLKQAGFYTLKSFDGYVFVDILLPSGTRPEDLQSCRFIEENRNLIFFGNVGTGKTHLATALGVEACKMGFQVRFFEILSIVVD